MKRILLFALLLQGCGLFNGNERQMLQRNWAYWRSLGISDYDYHYRISCYCAFTDPMLIEIRAGAISRIVDERTGEVLPSSIHAGWPTVDSLYARTLRNLDQGYDISVDFDAVYRYPTRVVGDLPHAVDDEYTLTATGLVPR